MAERTLSIVVKALGAVQAAKDIGKVDTAVGRIGKTAGRGLATAAGNIARLGAVAAAGLGLAVKTGLSDLAELENATTSVDGAIKQVGLTGQLTGAQVAGWANEIEKNVGAAFDDKAITQASTTLLRFGKVAPDNLRPALVVMTDLATKTGSVDSAASLLAKALADPTKAAGKLARAGVILTKEQQAQIKALVKSGDAAGAQKLLLDALAKATNGAALASQGPYQRALSTLADVSEDARKALAEGFLPVIERVASWLSTELAKPETLQRIRDFGKELAKGFDKLLTFAGTVPWGQIGDSLRIAGAGAKAVFDAFMGLPSWVQGAVLTGWGLNKLSGGALGSIVGELGKGLIKGVLGMTAGVVNINAAVVNGGGGGLPGGAGPGAVGAAGAAGGLSIAAVAAAAAVFLAVPLIMTAAGFKAGPRGPGRGSAFGPGGTVAPKMDPAALRALNDIDDRTGQVRDRLADVAETTRRNLQPLPENISAKQAKHFAALRANAESNRIAIVNAVHGIKLQVTVPVTVNAKFGTLTKKVGSTIIKIGNGHTGSYLEDNFI